MKTILVTVSLALAGVGSAQAQMFRPSVGSGAIVGAVAGGLIGGHHGDRWAEGAVVGAAAGALVGAALTPRQPAYSPPPPVYQTSNDYYGQRVYSSSAYAPAGATVVQAAPAPAISYAPVVPDASMVSPAPTIVEQVPPQVVQAPPPQVVYVERSPRVVYVPAPPPPVVYRSALPVFSFGIGFHSGPRYHGYHGHHWSHGGHSHHGHHGWHRGYRR